MQKTQAPYAPANLPSRIDLTTAQIHSLLHVAGTLLPYILNPHHELENVPNSHKLDGGSAAAAQATFINTCDRLDKILADESRWSMEIQKSLEASLSEVYEIHKKLLTEQREAIRTLNAPHSRFKPTLYALTDGNYAAILGDIKDLDNAIAAVGQSPAAALIAWDMIFRGEIPADLFNWLKAREAALEAGQTPPPMPKKPRKKKQ